ncbi:MAG: hypothetical protein ACRC6B_07850 [Fusobacteriaceae bacterium]
MSNVKQLVRAAPAHMFYKDGNMDSAIVELPPKTVYIYSPAIIDNGSGAMLPCWMFLGSYQLEATDLDSVLGGIRDGFTELNDMIDRQQGEVDFIRSEQVAGKLVVEGLQTANMDLVTRVNSIEELGGTNEFINLSDTPVDWTGSAKKALVVNDAGDGIEFITPPEDIILAALAEGNLPIKWNNMKQKIAASSSDISAGSIAENAFTLGLSGTAGRKYYLPDIVDADTSPLPAESVREGRLTIISQQGTGHREVVLTNGCKFSVGGNFVTTNLTLPRGQSWILLPAIYTKGDKVWSIIGSFSSNHEYSDLYNGYGRVGHKAITANTTYLNGALQQGTIATAIVAAIIGTTPRSAYLPEIVTADTIVPTSTQVRVGKVVTLWASGSGDLTVNLDTNQKWYIGGVESTDNRVINSGVMETYIATIQGDVPKWILTNRCKSDGSPVELDGLNTRIEALEVSSVGFTESQDARITRLEEQVELLMATLNSKEI